MAVRALDNTAFGFPAACFVCDPANPSGLRLSFVHDDEAHTVTSEFTLGPSYSGAPRFVHGGLVLTILDEAMAWAAISIAGRFAVSGRRGPASGGRSWSMSPTGSRRWWRATTRCR